MNITEICLPTRPQPDTIVAIYLLKKFGQNRYPGVDQAPVTISSVLDQERNYEAEGIILIDGGGGKFDHHGRTPATTATALVAQDLGLFGDPALKKLLVYTARDDKHGKGTISTDQIDRAFGLSGLIAALNKKHTGDYSKVIDIVFPLIEAHYEQEVKHHHELPLLVEKMKTENKYVTGTAMQNKKELTYVCFEDEDMALPGFFRSASGGKFDVVVQRRSTGHVNIFTRPLKRPDLRYTVALIREAEYNFLHQTNTGQSITTLGLPGRSDFAPDWYFDPATNSILNGGVQTSSVKPTKIPWDRFPRILEAGLPARFE